ncbi:MAG: DEAD/DEAH box helicase family protein [Thermomicrobiales bacterium]
MEEYGQDPGQEPPVPRRQRRSGRIRNSRRTPPVFWHTQGSGKSISMIFLCQKTISASNPATGFVIVTDRKELDEQIYGNFVSAPGAITELEAHAETGDHLRRLRREPPLHLHPDPVPDRARRALPGHFERDDIIVITDEAAASTTPSPFNMRDALPNASFGFTGTPLIQGEEQRTREVFGDYVSVYNFRQSIEDGATVRSTTKTASPRCTSTRI